MRASDPARALGAIIGKAVGAGKQIANLDRPLARVDFAVHFSHQGNWRSVPRGLAAVENDCMSKLARTGDNARDALVICKAASVQRAVIIEHGNRSRLQAGDRIEFLGTVGSGEDNVTRSEMAGNTYIADEFAGETSRSAGAIDARRALAGTVDTIFATTSGWPSRSSLAVSSLWRSIRRRWSVFRPRQNRLTPVSAHRHGAGRSQPPL